MALINCPECGKQISDKAKVCIHCGFELNFEKCPECGAPLFTADTVCRNCGCPREERTEKERIINIVPDRRGFSDLLTEKTAVELINYVQFSTAKIINWKSKGLLEDEFDSVLNNINPSSLQDPELIAAYDHLFVTLKNLKLNENQREYAREILRRNKKNAVTQCLNSFGSVFVPGSNPATMLASVIYTGISAGLNYKRAINAAEIANYEKEFEIDQYDLGHIDDLRSSLFISAAKVFSGKTNKAEGLVSENEMKQFADCVNRLSDENYEGCKSIEAFLESAEDALKAFPPYWIGLAYCYSKTGDYNKCISALNAFDLLTNNNPVFKKNPYSLEGARIHISAILSNITNGYLSDEEKSTLRKCIETTIQNTPSLQENIDNLHFDLVQLYSIVGDYNKAQNSIEYLKKRQLIGDNDRLEIQLKLIQKDALVDFKTVASIENIFSTITFGLQGVLNQAANPGKIKEFFKNRDSVLVMINGDSSDKGKMSFSKGDFSDQIVPPLIQHSVTLKEGKKAVLFETKDFSWNDLAMHPYLKITIGDDEAIFKFSIDPLAKNWPYSQVIQLEKKIDCDLSLLGDEQLISKFKVTPKNKGYVKKGAILAGSAALFNVIGVGVAAVSMGVANHIKNMNKIDLKWLVATMVSIKIGGEASIPLIGPNKEVLLEDFRG